jgi:hypothetical protein
MTRERQSPAHIPCESCAGYGWKYVTTKTAIPSASEADGWSGVRQRRACRVCGGAPADVTGAASA